MGPSDHVVRMGDEATHPRCSHSDEEDRIIMNHLQNPANGTGSRRRTVGAAHGTGGVASRSSESES